MGNPNLDTNDTVSISSIFIMPNVPNKNDDIVVPQVPIQPAVIIEQPKIDWDMIYKKYSQLSMNCKYNNTIRLCCKKIHPDAQIPKKNYIDDAAYDLACVADETFTTKMDQDKPSYIMAPGETKVFKTGLVISTPKGYFCQYTGRSGLAAKKSIDFMAGTIDSAIYRGEWGVVLVNHSGLPVTITAGDRIAQFVVLPVLDTAIVEVDSLDNTERSEKGWGSSGN